MKRNSWLKYGILLALVIALIMVLLPACAKPAPTPVPAPTPAPTPTLAPTAKPVSAADFFKQNPVTIVVGYAAGGGTDYAARLIASFWADVFGGDARVKNMPGGAGMVANNFVWKAKPDGLTLGLCPFGTNLGAPALFKQEGMDFDIGKFSYVGLYAEEPYTLAIAKKSPLNSVADLQKTDGLKFGADDKIGGTGMGEVLAIHLLGLKNAKIVSGFTGSPEISLAQARGEVDLRVHPAGTIKTEGDKGYVKPITIMGYEKADLFPDIPPISEAIKLTPEQDRLLKLYTATYRAGRVLFAPPGVPDDRLQFLRDGFDKMMAIDGFQSIAKTRYLVFPKPLTGAQVAALIQQAVTAPASDIAELKRINELYFK